MNYKIFGCKVNKYYTDKWLNSEFLKGKKGIFIATCVVTDNAKKKWLKFVKNIAKELSPPPNPLPCKEGEYIENKIYISGCGAFKNGKVQNDFYDLYPEIKYLENKIVLLDEDPKNSPHLTSPIGRGIEQNLKKIPKNIYTKKFVLIQGGCDSFCTYCLTVKKRGKHFSRSKENILTEILEFENNGGKEVVLTGVNLAAWGLNSTNPRPNKFDCLEINPPPSPLPCKEGEYRIPSKFADLLKYILKNTKIPRIRISSMGPEFIGDEVLKLLENTRIYPHFHYSIQSGSTNILKSMARHYDSKYIKNLLQKTRDIKRKDNVEISIGADIIVGFPGETDKDFKDTLNLIKDYKITKVHAFPFSGHNIGENVPAGKFSKQTDEKIKKERMWEVMNLSDEIRDEFVNNNIGKELEVLIEKTSSQPSPQGEGVKNIKWKGWTQNYIEADDSNFEIISGEIKRNSIIKGKLTR